MLNRRSFILGTTAFAACSPTSEFTELKRKRIAITMDDFALPEDKGLALERDAQIRAAFPVQAAGFVAAKYETNPAFDDVLAAWASDGHVLGNHSYSHDNSSEGERDVIWADIERADKRLSKMAGFETYFRFPFLADGRDREQQMFYYAKLLEAGYRHAPVTLDSIDWFVTDRLTQGLARGVEAERYRDYWMDSVMKMAGYAERLAMGLGVPDLPHQMLVHHNQLNALFLGDLVSRMQSEGWTFVDAKTALDHPFYASVPPLPTSGRSLLTVHKSQRGLTEPDYPADLRSFGGPVMDGLGL